MHVIDPVAANKDEPLEVSQSPAQIEFRDVTKMYGQVTAVQGLSLKVQRGEFLTILGPSGSGKTTTLMLLAGFEDERIRAGLKQVDRMVGEDEIYEALKAIRALYPDYPIWRGKDFKYEYTDDVLAIDVINGGPDLRLWVDDAGAAPGDLDALALADEAGWREEIADLLIY